MLYHITMKCMLLALFLLWMIGIPGNAEGIPLSTGIAGYSAFDPHGQWTTLLERHVDLDGNVDYKGFMKDREALADYIRQLSAHPPGQHTEENEKLAYYINLYNAATVRLILENYPVRSIKDIKKPWDREWIAVGGSMLSLGEIEHKILRKMGEPRIHFAINCASFSCPKLLATAYTAKDMEAQLDMVTRHFIQDTTRNRISEDSLELSRIFQWYKDDFGPDYAIIAFINTYSPVKISPDAKITYKKYDWSLNELQKTSD
jgi:hypothetical protein